MITVLFGFLVMASIIAVVVAIRVVINAGIVAVICYWLLPIVGVYPEPDLTECVVYGACLLLLGVTMNTANNVSTKKG